MIDNFLKDLRYGWRGLLRRKAFAAVAVFTLALGIAATTATFTVVDAVLLRKLPVADPDRVVVVHNQLPKLNLPRTQVSAPQYVDYSRQTDLFQSTAAFSTRNFNLSGVSMPERLQAGRVSATFFPTLGINPVAGRFFNPEEDRFGSGGQSRWRAVKGDQAAGIEVEPGAVLAKPKPCLAQHRLRQPAQFTAR